MHIEEKIRGNVAVVALSGELLDYRDEAVLDREIVSLTSDNITHIVLDFKHLNDINSQGLTALVSAMKTVRRHGGEIKIAGLDAHLVNVFAVTRLVQLFETYESVPRALASYSN
jgi:anti-anti-sigma factor